MNTQLTLLVHLRGLWAEDYETSDFSRPQSQELFESILNSDHIENFDDLLFTSSRFKFSAKDIEPLFDRALVTSGIALKCLEQPDMNQKQLTQAARHCSDIRNELKQHSMLYAYQDLLRWFDPERARQNQ